MLDTNFDGAEDPREIFERERNNTMVLTESAFTPMFKKEAASIDGEAAKMASEAEEKPADGAPATEKEPQETDFQNEEQDEADEQRKRGVFEWLFGKGEKKDENAAVTEDREEQAETIKEETAKNREDLSDDTCDKELNSQMSLRERVGADIRPNESIRETMSMKIEEGMSEDVVSQAVAPPEEVSNADVPIDESRADESAEEIS